MAKMSGLGMGAYVDGIDLSGDVGAINSIAGGPALLDVTGIDKSAPERIGGILSGSMSFNSWFNPTASPAAAHATLSTRPTTDRELMIAVRKAALGDDAAMMVGKQINYDGNRQQDGSLAFSLEAQSNGLPVHWGNLLTAGIRTDSTATNPTSGLDDLAGTPTSTSFGATIWVQVLAFSGTSVTFTLRDAATEPTYAAVTGGASSAINAVGGYHWSTSATQTIRRFLTIGTSGTFSNVQFVCAVVRHRTLSL